MMHRDSGLTIDEVVDEICRINFELASTWKNVGGWAPREAAKLLDESRLDWLVSLSHTLRLWIAEEPSDEELDGRLILAWTNLGALVEGSMKFLLSVYASTYSDSVTSKKAQSFFEGFWDRRKAEPKEVDGLTLESLRQFYSSEVWLDSQRAKWNPWINHIQIRRNAIHAYRHRDLGDFEQFAGDVRTYLEFLGDVTGCLPEPPSWN